MTLQVKLGSIRVELAPPHPLPSPAPSPSAVGLHVYLAPRDRASADFVHFVVDGQGRLAAPGGGTVPQTIGTRLWCLWDPAELLPPSGSVGYGPAVRPGGDPHDRAQWQRYPLPVEIGANAKLLLPNTRELIVRQVDLAGGGIDMDFDFDHARVYYRLLRVELVKSPLAAPALPAALAPPWTALLKDDYKAIVEPKGQGQFVEIDPQPDFSSAAWLAGLSPAERKRTVLVIYVGEFVHPNALAFGNAWPRLQVGWRQVIDQRQAFGLPPCPLVFLERPDKRPQVNPHLVAYQLALAHELGHVLLYDLGFGRELFTKYGKAAAAKQFLSHLALAPGNAGQQLFAQELFDKEHAFARRADQLHSAVFNNLMAPSPGERLTFWQVAAIRAAALLQP